MEDPGFLALGQLRTEGGAGVEARDARPAGPQALGEGALRNEFQFQLAGKDLTLELPVLADIGCHDLFHLPGSKQNTHAETVHAGVVADDGQALHPAVAQREDQVLGYAAQAETTRGQRHVVVEQPGEGGSGVGVDLAHAKIVVTDDTEWHRWMSTDRLA